MAILATLAIWFPLGAFIGSRYTPVPRPPGAYSFVGIEKNGTGEFIYVIHFAHAKLADTPADPTRSPILLYENEQLLGPAHSTTDAISSLGRGRYLHTPAAIYFSTSDNTDPRNNGQQYSWTIGPARPDQTPPD